MRNDPLELRLKAFSLSSFVINYQDLAARAEKEGWSHVRYLDELSNLEAHDRQDRRTARLLKAAKLPRDKTLATLKKGRFPPVVRGQIDRLCGGEFLEGANNLCIFGNPGTGKTHVMSAICHELVRVGRSVHFTTVSALVEKLLEAKRDLRLNRELARLDHFDALALDDIGYVKQDRSEMEVLFTLLAERYERKSVMITSNLVFSKWDQIFKDPMTTAAAVDRVVHHSVILELNVRSYREEDAASRQRPQGTKDEKEDKEGKGEKGGDEKKD
jgi:DNA replication protein DnaC